MQEFLGVSVIELNTDVHLNEKFVPKMKLLDKTINTQGSFRKAFQKLIPFPELRKTMRLQLNKLNKSAEKPEKLDPQLKKYILENTYYEEILKLEKVLDMDFSIWYDES